MKRTVQSYKTTDLHSLKERLLSWAQQFEEIVWLDSNQSVAADYDAILAVDACTSIKTDWTEGFAQLEEYQLLTKDWLFGYLSYDMKNDVEQLTSSNADGIFAPDLFFFQPKRLFLIKGNTIALHYLPMADDEMVSDWKDIQHLQLTAVEPHQNLAIKLKIHKDAYKNKVNEMLAHIARGDIYEANLCQEFYAHGTISPYHTYQKLNAISSPPFASFVKIEEVYLLSASPERYLKKEGQRVTSHPIKGTARRGMNAAEDALIAEALSQDSKERSENIMIVDLVRNDLSHTAIKDSVKVEALCEVHRFKQVHQMISTISALVDNDESPVNIIRTTYPMGSMTGAPKKRAMEIIEELEASKRGMYSGAVGYFSPVGDFDFNVVIRSILYNSAFNYISYQVGSAITAKSNPDSEYQECLLKAKAMREVLIN